MNPAKELLCVATAFALFAACTNPKPPSPPDYGEAYNEIRKEIGLMPIPEGWELEWQKNSDMVFVSPPDIDSTLNEPKIYYAGKSLQIKNDTLFYENDQFILVNFPESYSPDVLAVLTYAYFYYPDAYGRLGWFYGYSTKQENPENGKIYFGDGIEKYDSEGYLLPVTRHDVDSVLTLWQMNYPAPTKCIRLDTMTIDSSDFIRLSTPYEKGGVHIPRRPYPVVIR